MPVSTSSQPVVNLSGYRFVSLEHLPVLQADLHDALAGIGVLGTVLLAEEGINVALAGTAEQAQAVRALLDSDTRLKGMWLKESESDTLPFSKLKVRIRHEIIAFDGPQPTPLADLPAAPNIAPTEVRDWIEQGRNMVLLDTRNRYEIESGTFDGAMDLGIDSFREFKSAVRKALDDGTLTLDTPIVSFCTGGVRCEKAAPWMLQQGFEEVYQIEGGIIHYFAETGGAHWRGDCFVFDDRVELTPTLEATGAVLCQVCHRASSPERPCGCSREHGSAGSADSTGSTGHTVQPSRTASATV